MVKRINMVVLVMMVRVVMIMMVTMNMTTMHNGLIPQFDDSVSDTG